MLFPTHDWGRHGAGVGSDRGRTLLEPLEPRLLLSGTTYQVDTLGDDIDVDGAVTLREAIEAANTNLIVNEAPAGSATEADIITFDPALAGQTIVLGGEQLEITEDLQINGLGVDLTAISADNLSRVLQVGSAATVHVTDLSILDGYEALGTGGGGIYNQGTLTLTNVVIRNNATETDGGGILNEGDLAATDVTFSGNSAVWGGGGICSYAGVVDLTGTSVDDNVAGECGGGILNSDSGTLFVFDSAVQGNRTTDPLGYGGGICNWAAMLVVRSTVVANITDGAGGGIYHLFGAAEVLDSTVADNEAAEEGGGLFSDGELTLVNTTVTGNSAGFDGGGVFNLDAGSLELTNSTVIANSAIREGGGVFSYGDLDMHNTVVADNAAASEPDLYGLVMSGNSTNFIGTDDGDPMVAPVTNGDGVITHYDPQPGSPLIDAGDNAAAVDGDGDPLITDQIGNIRIVNGTVDIGAVEFDSVPIPPGDADGDGDVDLDDFVILKQNFGASTGAKRSDGDFDGDGDVDLDDFVILKKTFTLSGSAAAPSVGTTTDLLAGEPAVESAPSSRRRWAKRRRRRVIGSLRPVAYEFDVLAAARMVGPLG